MSPETPVSISVRFVPRDFWIGAYLSEPEVTVKGDGSRHATGRTLYVCLVPMFPVVIRWRRWRAGDAPRALWA